MNAMFPKQVEILVHAAVQRIFNGNDRKQRPSPDNILKYFVESFTRNRVASLYRSTLSLPAR